MTKYLGSSVSALRKQAPFCHWPVKRSVDDTPGDETRISYTFKGHGLELQCGGDERITTIFLHGGDKGGFDEALAGLPFSLTRAQVLERLGTPAASGEAFTHPVLGGYGAWDRFASPGYSTHVQYQFDADQIQLVTLMLSDAVPAQASETEELIITPMPALVTLLLAKEQEKGAPLTRDEVEKIRDDAASVALPRDAREKLDESRGYRDIDPDDAWAQWQEARNELT